MVQCPDKYLFYGLFLRANHVQCPDKYLFYGLFLRANHGTVSRQVPVLWFISQS